MSASITTSPTTPFTSSPSPAATAATLPPFLASPPSATLPPAMTTTSASSLLSQQQEQKPQHDAQSSQPHHQLNNNNNKLHNTHSKPSQFTAASLSSSYSSSSSGLSMHMPAAVAANAHLATAVSSLAPSWAIAHDAAHPCGNYLEVMGQRNYHNIFRLPNLGGVIEKWLFTRPSMEAISEDSFANSAVESMTLFRIEGLDRSDQSVLITPTVSSHYLHIPCQTINGYTVGLAYLDILYERDSFGIRDNRVPPLRLGRFVIDDATGEMFCSAWVDNLMVVAWTQSIIKCERVREFLLFEAPRDGTAPRSLLLRNSFFERRSCALCGLGRSISTLPPPCSGIDNRRLSQDPASSSNNNSSSSSHSSSQRQVARALTNIAAIYRRFRGSYFGVVLKTRYGADRQPQSQQLVPVFAELKHGLHTVKVGFKNNLRKNIDFVIGGASNDGYFGMNPRSAARTLLLLRASNPVEAYPSATAPAITDAEASYYDSHRGNGNGGRTAMSLSRAGSVVPSSDDGDSSVHTGISQHHHRLSRASSPSTVSDMRLHNNTGSRTSSATSKLVRDVNAPKRRRSEDPLERDSVMHKRKVRNRISAQRSNKQRKLALDQKKEDLERLKLLRPVLEQRLADLRKENEELRFKVYGDVGNNGGGDNKSNSRLLAMMTTQAQGNNVGNELLQGQYQHIVVGQQQQQEMDIVNLGGQQQQQQQLDDNGMTVDVIAQFDEQQQLLQQPQQLQTQQQQQPGDVGGGNDNDDLGAGGWKDEDAKIENVLNISDPCLFVR